MNTPSRKPLLIAAGLMAIVGILALFCVMMPEQAANFIATTLAGSAMVGMAVTENKLIQRATGCRKSYPVAADLVIYEGTLTYIDASGYLTNVTGSGANRFAGVAIRKVDNTDGSAGDLQCEVWTDGEFLLTGSGFSQASVGKVAYGADNYAVTAVAAANAVPVAVITEYVSSTQVLAKLVTSPIPYARTVETKTANYTVAAGDSGKIFDSTGAAGTITATLPAALPGMEFMFRVGAAQEHRIDPDGTETISLPSTGVAGAAGKYLTANAAGETVHLVCVVAGTWNVFGYTGTWTAEP